MSFAAMLPRALIAWLGRDRSYRQREPAALVLTAAAGAGRGQLGERQALLPPLTLPGIAKHDQVARLSWPAQHVLLRMRHQRAPPRPGGVIEYLTR